MTWRTRRRTIIVFIISIVLAIVASVLLWFTQSTPTCSDGVQNGIETGVDCGGSCSLICAVDVQPISVTWAKSFKVDTGLYNLAAQIENRNQKSGATVSYAFNVYGPSGLVISIPGTTTIRTSGHIGIFLPRISLEVEPAKTDLVITHISDWSTNLAHELSIQTSATQLSNTFTTPTLTTSLTNIGNTPTNTLSVMAVIKDDSGNPLAVSQTVTPGLDFQASIPLTFTWPTSIDTGTKICEVGSANSVESFLGDVVVAIDRSGSMNASSSNPPEPLTTVKKAAEDFVRLAGKEDKVAIVSFATDATIMGSLRQAGDTIPLIETIAIKTGGVQQTNIGDGLLQSYQVLNQSSSAYRSIVLLTDGEATEPTKAGDLTYPEEYAQSIADAIKSDNVNIYVIGLGNKVNTEFLTSIASKNGYFSAEEIDSIGGIYKQIATSLCRKQPAVIDFLISEQ